MLVKLGLTKWICPELITGAELETGTVNRYDLDDEGSVELAGLESLRMGDEYPILNIHYGEGENMHLIHPIEVEAGIKLLDSLTEFVLGDEEKG